MKRSRDIEFESAEAMAKCLMLLSKVGEVNQITKPLGSDRLFTCKTCNKQFPSFQALGGHRASHKRPKITAEDLLKSPISSPAKPKAHECSICGLEFPIGQALGGHMRRHRNEASGWNEGLVTQPLLPVVPVMKKSNSKRVMSLDLSLELPESDLELRLGKVTSPVLKCFM